MVHRPTVLLAACLLGASHCGGSEPRVSLAEEGVRHWPQRSSGPQKLPIRVAVAGVISPRATFDAYAGLLDYLAIKLERPVELLQRATYAETNELIRSGEAALGFVCSGGYVEGHRDFGLELLVVPEVRGQTTYYSYVIVPKDSTAESLSDLRGRRFAFSDPLSNSGHLAVVWRLLELGESPTSFFSSTHFTYSHDNSIRAVADRLVEGAAVDSLVYDQLVGHDATIGARTRVVEKAGPYAISPVVVHPALDAGLKAELRTVLLNMASDPAGRKALTPLVIDRFVAPEEAAYDSIRVMAALVRGWN